MLEYWNIGILGIKKNGSDHFYYPFFHYSIIPIFQHKFNVRRVKDNGPTTC
jgi:hypothetical protein